MISVTLLKYILVEQHMSVHATVCITHVLDLDAYKCWSCKDEADRKTVTKYNCSFETQKPQFLQSHVPFGHLNAEYIGIFGNI